MKRKKRHNGETEHIVNKAKGRYVRKGKLKRNSRSNFTSISKGGGLDEIKKKIIHQVGGMIIFKERLRKINK